MNQKQKHKIELPYWPSQDFIRETSNMAREKGFKGTDDQLYDEVIRAYRVRRAEILADKKMKEYENPPTE